MSEPNLKEIAYKLGRVADDLASARAIVDQFRGDIDIQTASHLALGIECLLIRAGRAVEESSTSLGEDRHFDWEDYPPQGEGDE